MTKLTIQNKDTETNKLQLSMKEWIVQKKKILHMKHVTLGVIKITILPKESSSFFRETQKKMLVTQNDSFSHLLSLYAKKATKVNVVWC